MTYRTHETNKKRVFFKPTALFISPISHIGPIGPTVLRLLLNRAFLEDAADDVFERHFFDA